MTPSTTLRTVNDLPTTPAVLADSTVVLVDYQVTYTTGVMALDGWAPALDAAADLLARARAAGSTVVHVLHDGGPGTPYDVSAPVGRVHERVAPIAGEAVVVKNAPNAFVGTDLGAVVDAAGHVDVVIAGFMTHMCVTFTAEGAFLRGNRPTVVADASATRSLPGVDGPVAARDLHRAALATIGDLHAVVVPTAAELG